MIKELIYLMMSITDISGKEGHWIWLHSDTNLTDTFWGPYAPNYNPGNTEDCVVLIVKTDIFWWQDTNCLAQEVQHKKVATICQYDTNNAFTTVTTQESTTVTETTAIDSCPDGWEEFEDNCYQYRTNKEDWSVSNIDCTSSGGHLTSIHSQAENDFVARFTEYPGIWLGSSNLNSEVGVPSNAQISAPFFGKQWFSLKYVLAAPPPQNFWSYV